MKIGFIGLGNVGGKLASSLLRNKFELTVRDLDEDLTKDFQNKAAEIAPGGNLTLHYHSPAEIYVVTGGNGMLNKSGELEEIKKGDVVYIAENAEHALKNIGKETLEFYWIFPTDRFSEVEYISAS